MLHNLKLVAALFIWTIAGAIVVAITGYLCGTIGGLILTFYNNHFLHDAPQGSYLWWASFVGYIVAVLLILPGMITGFIVGLIWISRQKPVNRIVR